MVLGTMGGLLGKGGNNSLFKPLAEKIAVNSPMGVVILSSLNMAKGSISSGVGVRKGKGVSNGTPVWTCSVQETGAILGG